MFAARFLVRFPPVRRSNATVHGYCDQANRTLAAARSSVETVRSNVERNRDGDGCRRPMNI